MLFSDDNKKWISIKPVPLISFCQEGSLGNLKRTKSRMPKNFPKVFPSYALKIKQMSSSTNGYRMEPLHCQK